MKTDLPLLDQITIASPCPASWEQMTGNDQVRFCKHCQRNVYNFSEMTRAEAEELILAKEGRLCGRFYRRTDGTTLTRDCPVGLRQVRTRLVRALCGAAATFLALGAGIFGWRAVAAEKSATGIEMMDRGPLTRFASWVTPMPAGRALGGVICMPQDWRPSDFAGPDGDPSTAEP